MAPLFSLPDQAGKIHRLSDYFGRWVLVYFYPKDDTPGCTAEACSLRDNFPRFGKVKAVILGISVDSVSSHARFAAKYGLNFTLLADEQKQAVKAYGVWGEKSFMGKKYLGISRSSFLIDPAGKIAKVYPKVRPAEHAAEVLKDLEKFQRQ
ncbi:MAG: thioredoxin-dependent thiol peroxidase [Patescibacteria group bacterium]|nr:thioredoxin-dependent thiol peroxidase [Patescibacteria group bacterium]